MQVSSFEPEIFPSLTVLVVSTGLLVFPAEEGTGSTQFKNLQIQGLSMYIMRYLSHSLVKSSFTT